MATQAQLFSSSVMQPAPAAMDDIIVAYGQNGEPLRPQNGFPLRLVVPGFEGILSVKWLRRSKLGERTLQ